MYFLAQNRHKPKALTVQLYVNKRKYNNDLDPSLGKGVPPLAILGLLRGSKWKNAKNATYEGPDAARVVRIGNSGGIGPCRYAYSEKAKR